MIAFQVADMKDTRGAKAVTAAVRALDRAAVVRIDLPSRTVEIDPARASARQLGDAIFGRQAIRPKPRDREKAGLAQVPKETTATPTMRIRPIRVELSGKRI